MNTSLRLLLLASFLPCGAALALGQPAGRGEGPEVTIRYAHGESDDLDGAGAGAEAGVDSYQLAFRDSAAVGERTRLLYGFDWTRHVLDLGGEAWLPEDLQSLALSLGVAQRLDDRWRLLLSVSPRLAAADADFSAARVDVPVLALASYTASAELTWSFGLRYSARSDLEVMPVAGVNWRFAPDWQLSLGWPESGVSYRATERLTLRAVAHFQGGDYHVDADPRPLAAQTGRPLEGAWLEYREIRVGLAAEYALGGKLGLRLEAGRSVGQRFEYLDRGVELEGDGAFYGSAGLTARF